MQIVKGVEMLCLAATMPTGESTLIHPVLLQDESRVILIDTGYPGQAPLIKASLQEKKLSLESVTDIILTHHDMDHIGSLKQILQLVNHTICVMAHTDEVPYIQCELPPIRVQEMEKRIKMMSPQGAELLRSLIDKLKTNYIHFRTHVDRYLQDGEELPYCGGILIIHTPGHTPGHVSLYLKKHRLLIAGDALFVEAGNLIKAPDVVTCNQEEALMSLRKLAGYDIESVICYHGGLYKHDVRYRLAELAKS